MAYPCVSIARHFNPNLERFMTKRDIVVRISDETGLVQQQVLDIVQKTLDYIAEAVAKHDKVELRNFGVFEVKVRKARIGRNPNAPAADVPIPPRAVVKFKPGKEMREAVLKLTPAETAPPPAPPPPRKLSVPRSVRALLPGRRAILRAPTAENAVLFGDCSTPAFPVYLLA